MYIAYCELAGLPASGPAADFRAKVDREDVFFTTGLQLLWRRDRKFSILAPPSRAASANLRYLSVQGSASVLAYLVTRFYSCTLG